MSRITTTILVILLLMNGTVTIMAGSGLSDDLGVTISPGVENEMDNVVSNAEEGFSADSGAGDTLFSLFSAGASSFSLLIKGVFAAPDMFINMGFPSWFVVPVFAPMYVIATLEVIYMTTGRVGI